MRDECHSARYGVINPQFTQPPSNLSKTLMDGIGLHEKLRGFLDRRPAALPHLFIEGTHQAILS
jgi:hypothetical protein